ncbi:MAG: DUF459 domain-containing protein [Actinomycetota bacterium]|nr:DUF459 domain-containing protein [Actinomycetota bacterium]
MEKMTKTEADSKRDPTATNQGAPAGEVLLAGLVGLLIAIFLNSSVLLTDAKRLPDGSGRSIALAVWNPIESAGSFLGLTWPRAAGDRLLGRSEPEQPIALVRKPIETYTGSEKEEPVVLGVENEQDLKDRPKETLPESPTAQWTVDRPFELWVIGDSMVQFFGDILVSLAETSNSVEATSEPVLASGLSRPDYFDWPTRIAEIMTKHDPDAVVVIFGGNDAQNIKSADGTWLARFEDSWLDEYRRRIGTVMDLVTSDRNRILLWVAQPPMRRQGFDERMQLLNNLYRAEAADRERVQYVDLRGLFTDSSGEYARYLPDDEGKLVDVRLTDGVHLSHWGGEWLSALLLQELRKSPKIDQLWNR